MKDQNETNTTETAQESGGSAGAALLDCPFCGSIPGEPKKEGGSDERMGYNFTMRISCKCGANIGRSSSRNDNGWCNDTGQALSAVVTAWNMRAFD